MQEEYHHPDAEEKSQSDVGTELKTEVQPGTEKLEARPRMHG